MDILLLSFAICGKLTTLINNQNKLLPKGEKVQLAKSRERMRNKAEV